MHNDNMYINDGQPFALRPPVKQVEERQKEISQTLEQLPVLKQVIKRFDQKIAATDSVKKALEIAEKYDISREDALIVLDIVNQQLTPERAFIMAKVERASKR